VSFLLVIFVFFDKVQNRMPHESWSSEKKFCFMGFLSLKSRESFFLCYLYFLDSISNSFSVGVIGLSAATETNWLL